MPYMSKYITFGTWCEVQYFMTDAEQQFNINTQNIVHRTQFVNLVEHLHIVSKFNVTSEVMYEGVIAVKITTRDHISLSRYVA